MKIIPALIVFAFMSTSFSCADSSAKKPNINSNNGFAVVELFTSEGCSSCPPADKAVAELLKEHNSNVYVLGYHVDYWDNLGWKDIFSNKAYTQLQRDYAKSFKLSSVYTPQVVINGTEQFVGSDVNKLHAAVKNDLQRSSDTQLSITAKAMDDNEILVNYSTNAANAKLKVALIQLTAENKIQHGENTGATLHHVNIVRDLETITTTSAGNAVLKLPENLQPEECHVIAFAQANNNNQIIAAVETSIQ